MESGLIPILHIVAALLAGGVIGFERTFHGRAAGFRTYALVCMASTMAMLVTTSHGLWPGAVPAAGPGDQTRVVQGILTGIGFLGVGVIVKEGLSVRGLTTAASIWTTAVVGILIGMRYYGEALAAVLLMLGTLSVFRWLEDRMPKDLFAQVILKVAGSGKPGEPELDALMTQAGLRIVQAAYVLDKGGSEFEYELIVLGAEEGSLSKLARILANHAAVTGFRISPTRD